MGDAETGGPVCTELTSYVVRAVPTNEVGRATSLAAGVLEVAHAHPVAVERADAIEWLDACLAIPRPGVVTVVMHSIFQQYLGERQADLDAAFVVAVARATSDAPLARVRLEPAPDQLDARLGITMRPGGGEQERAAASFHVGPVHWYETPRPR